MKIEFDPEKRDATLIHRGLDMGSAPEVFDAAHITIEDDRVDYGEPRFITIGMLDERMVVLVWTWRGENLRVISMRKANEREQERYSPQLG
jgi:uncharacterized DUF497 family protein